jgi:uncharacterized protein (DUF885 family)
VAAVLLGTLAMPRSPSRRARQGRLPRRRPSEAARAALRALFTASDEAYLERNPIDALFRGDLRHADRFGEYLSDDYFAAERRAAESGPRGARADRSRGARPGRPRQLRRVPLHARDGPARLRGGRCWRPTVVRPIDHFAGVQSWFPQVASGEGIAPFGSVDDYDDNLKRLDGYVAFLDAAIVRMREGLAAGIVQPKLVMSERGRAAGQPARAGRRGLHVLPAGAEVPGGPAGGRPPAARGGLCRRSSASA